jgi:hypothetical protein
MQEDAQTHIIVKPGTGNKMQPNTRIHNSETRKGTNSIPWNWAKYHSNSSAKADMKNKQAL